MIDEINTANLLILALIVLISAQLFSPCLLFSGLQPTYSCNSTGGTASEFTFCISQTHNEPSSSFENHTVRNSYSYYNLSPNSKQLFRGAVTSDDNCSKVSGNSDLPAEFVNADEDAYYVVSYQGHSYLVSIAGTDSSPNRAG